MRRAAERGHAAAAAPGQLGFPELHWAADDHSESLRSAVGGVLGPPERPLTAAIRALTRVDGRARGPSSSIGVARICSAADRFVRHGGAELPAMMTGIAASWLGRRGELSLPACKGGGGQLLRREEQ